MRVSTSIIATVIGLLTLSERGNAFSGPRPRLQITTKTTNADTKRSMCPSSNENDDPTKVWYAGLANSIQNVLTNSPLNEGKKALVKALAGEYDEEATRAKLEGLISENEVLMLSFVK
mmetsp:Transcript_26626/g.37505  ORF Transcript_26626/g.37505 Transcript_26626/m.37505 type:complete len:118 (-) Transcript_26626:554-907(-)